MVRGRRAGVGGAVGWGNGYFWVPLIPIAPGPIGGASLGMVLRDRGTLVAMTLLGALGTFLGLLVAFILYSFVGTYNVNYAGVVTGPIFGAVLGAALGAAFLDAKKVVILAGAVGFGIGVPAGDYLGSMMPGFEDAPVLGDMPWIAIAGFTGGTSLGATMGYLERCEPARRGVV